MMKTFFDVLQGMESVAFVVAIISAFFEVSKIKFNPLSSLFKWIGSKINQETVKKLDAVKDEVEELDDKISKVDEKVDHSDINRLRWEILNFSMECRQKQRHTRDQFVHVIESNAEYHAILEARGEQNGVLDAEFAYISELYDKCLRENDFL